jgi:hypothetical protein
MSLREHQSSAGGRSCRDAAPSFPGDALGDREHHRKGSSSDKTRLIHLDLTHADMGI